MLCIDIETVPTAAAMAVPFDRATATPPSNYKSPDAIAKWLDAQEQDYAVARAKQCSINPRLGRILAIAYALGDESASPEVLYAQTPAEEADILRQFWALCLDVQALPLVTWNGAFDLRWIIIRSIANNVSPTVGTVDWFRRYSFHPHCDVKTFLLQEWGSKIAGEGLSEWAALCGLDGKQDGWDGSKVYPAYLAGRHDEIREYAAGDVRTTLALYRRIRPFI